VVARPRAFAHTKAQEPWQRPGR